MTLPPPPGPRHALPLTPRVGPEPGQKLPVTPRSPGFSLVEMLIVMAIAAVVIGLTVPAVNSVLGGKAVARGINDVSGIIEYARAEAMARRTYVWVVFANTESGGNAELRIAAAVSKDGLGTHWGSNLQPLTRVTKVAGVRTVIYSELPQAMRTYMEKAAVDLTTFTSPGNDNLYVIYKDYVGFNSGQTPKFEVGGQDFNGANYLGFSPEGELLSAPDPYNTMFKTLFCVGLAPTRGTVVQANAKDAAVVTVYGSSAKLRITRP